MKPIKFFPLLFTLASVVIPLGSEAASVLVNQPAPYIQHQLGDTAYSIFYGASSRTPARPESGAFYDLARGYRFINVNLTDDPNLIWLDVSTDQKFTPTAGQSVFVSLSTTSAVGNEISLRGAGVLSNNTAPPVCNTGGVTTCPGISGGRGNLSAVYNPGSVLRVSFAVSDLCQAPGVSLVPPSICDTGGVPHVLDNNTLSTQVVAAFTVGPMPSATPVPITSSNLLTFNLTLTDLAPVVNCPLSGKIEDFYFPGDKQVFFSPSLFPQLVGPIPALLNLQTGVPLQSLVLLANRGPNPIVSGDGMPGVEVVGYTGASGVKLAVDGFQNVDQSSPGYQAAVFAENAAGIISLPDPVHSCLSFPENIKPRPVLGVLNESKCFIATAAYHDGRAAPVMMLRKFRDQILSRTAWGRNFIDTYYRYSPAIAEWAWDKPFIRSIALRALAPVELVAWAVLQFSHAEQVSTQPYIDRLKKKLDETNPQTPASGESYIESEKRKLGADPTPSSQTYIEGLKQKLGPKEKSDGYSQEVKKNLPPEKERESPISAVKEGRDHYPVPERGEIKNAVSFKLGVSPGLKVVNATNSVTFERIYGSGWQPDLVLHFERQMIHSENFGSLALGVDLGVTYAEGFGQLAYGFGASNSTQSLTKLSFFQLPLILSGYYRFNLFRLLRPYVGAGLGSMFYGEVRKDSEPSKKGYAPLYSLNLGVALLLDFFDRSTALDGYLSSGIQHTYLFAEYNRLETFSKTGVTFERNGIYSGFLFEF